jgi:protein-S-isoprenylcysteine O-methyltransferase Ste14
MSFIRGREIFAKRSELNVPRNGLLALLTMLVTAIVAVALFYVIDGKFFASTLVSQALVMGAGQVFVAQVILRRADFKQRWGDRAFSIAFRWLAIPGLTFVFVGIPHFAWLEGERILPREIALIPFLYLLVSGIVLWLRAVFVFGIDNLSLMYVYFPNESHLVNSNVYSVLRHPVYSGVMRITFAIVLWNGSAFALFAGLVAPLAMTVWLRWAEEPELIERFGDGYRDYRRRVPAFFNLDPRTWMVLWKFLARGQ